MRNGPRWSDAMPGLFVVLWSTGFLGAKFGLPYAEPFTFLTLRFIAVIAMLAVAVVLTRAPWPGTSIQAAHIAVSGVLVHGVYLAGVFSAIHRGLPSGLVALVAGLQPILTAIVAGRLLGEQVVARQWLGLSLGLAGVAMVASTRLTGLAFAGFGWDGMACAVAALTGITAGTLYQKRFCTGMDLRTGALVQYGAALALVAPLSAVAEAGVVHWSGEFLFALGWLVVVLSLGAISLLMTLIRVGEAARVSSLFYLVPPVTAVLAFLLFGESLSSLALAGMAITAIGVALVVRRG